MPTRGLHPWLFTVAPSGLKNRTFDDSGLLPSRWVWHAGSVRASADLLTENRSRIRPRRARVVLVPSPWRRLPALSFPPELGTTAVPTARGTSGGGGGSCDLRRDSRRGGRSIRGRSEE